jgi:hypothetical protein
MNDGDGGGGGGDDDDENSSETSHNMIRGHTAQKAVIILIRNNKVI